MSKVKEQILADLKAFADDESEVIVEPNGTILFVRGGQDYIIKVGEDRSSGRIMVKYNNFDYTFREFLSKHVANLPILAKKIIEKRKKVEPFIDGNANLYSTYYQRKDKTVASLDYECNNPTFFGTKICFITADAGHGKTALLKEYQYQQANKFLNNSSDFIFWHIDLQGRELVRLNEAMMYDLGELRIGGIYYSSIISLIKNNLLVVAIDGFDELAAEIGGTSALGALSSLVSNLDGLGTIVAASRRTFFDTQDYAKRTGLLKGNIAGECVINEMRLENWSKDENIEYCSYFEEDKNKLYEDLLSELYGDQNHPILVRPFLFTKVIQGITEARLSPAEFIGGFRNPYEGIATVVEAFTEREVQKWKERDKETGLPYLTFDQHIKLMSFVAQEMWDSQKDILEIDEIQFYTKLLCEEWGIETRIQSNVVEMVKFHAFLIPIDQNDRARKFDHEEFKNYFLSRYLANQLSEIPNLKSTNELKKIFYKGQLPDVVAMYACKYIPRDETFVINVLNSIEKIIKEEWKPTFLQINAGTIIPFLINGVSFNENFLFEEKIVFSNQCFENKTLTNLHLKNGDFINISFRNTEFINITIENSIFNEITIDIDSTLVFRNVRLINTKISAIIEKSDDEIIDAAYSPNRINEILLKYSIFTGDDVVINEYSGNQTKESSIFKKLTIRFLNKYHKITSQYENSIREENTFGAHTNKVTDVIIPLLVKHNILRKESTGNSRQAGTEVLRLNYDLETIFKSESNDGNVNILGFWQELDNLNENA
jgi:hypothetical protein